MSPESAKRILIIGLDEARWGPARLVESLRRGNFQVAALCTEQNPLYHSGFLDRRYLFKTSKSWRTLGRQINATARAFKPHLIVPADEMTIALLQHLVRKWPDLASNGRELECLRFVLPSESPWEVLTSKLRTRELAERLGVLTPRTLRVHSIKEAQLAAQNIGYPVYLKKSFAWAGEGNRLCADQDKLDTAYDAFSTRKRSLKNFGKRLLGREWYPNQNSLEVQEAVDGPSAMYNVLAWQGEVIGGFYAKRVATSTSGGPSTVVSISENDECRSACTKITREMKLSGFVAFDFIQDHRSGRHLLLECNPRPNQIFHLAEKLGLDLVEGLARAMAGITLQKGRGTVARAGSFALFPQCALAAHLPDLSREAVLDVPSGDDRLLDFMKSVLKKSEKSTDILRGPSQIAI